MSQINNPPSPIFETLGEILKPGEEIKIITVDSQQVSIKRNITHENDYREYESKSDFYTEKNYNDGQ